jgi:hypothetical protein
VVRRDDVAARHDVSCNQCVGAKRRPLYRRNPSRTVRPHVCGRNTGGLDAVDRRAAGRARGYPETSRRSPARRSVHSGCDGARQSALLRFVGIQAGELLARPSAPARSRHRPLPGSTALRESTDRRVSPTSVTRVRIDCRRADGNGRGAVCPAVDAHALAHAGRDRRCRSARCC